MKGRVHSIESMGLVDGPGIRTVVFLQGCGLRCAYCHNPDTWTPAGGRETDDDELLAKLLRYRPYYRDKGGVTFSGGEPLFQKEFLLSMLKKCRNAGINTCIDTAGGAEGDFEEILKYTDLVIFDIKHYDPHEYRKITGKDMECSLNFLKQVQKAGVPMWIRHVVVPGITDSEEHIRRLAGYVRNIANVHKIELLPFHQLGRNKYAEMGIKYSLEDTAPMDKGEVKRLQEIVDEITGGQK